MTTIEITDEASFNAAAERFRANAARSETEAGEELRLESVGKVVSAVRERGDAAVTEFTAQFDRVTLAP